LIKRGRDHGRRGREKEWCGADGGLKSRRGEGEKREKELRKGRRKRK